MNSDVSPPGTPLSCDRPLVGVHRFRSSRSADDGGRFEGAGGAVEGVSAVDDAFFLDDFCFGPRLEGAVKGVTPSKKLVGSDGDFADSVADRFLRAEPVEGVNDFSLSFTASMNPEHIFFGNFLNIEAG